MRDEQERKQEQEQCPCASIMVLKMPLVLAREACPAVYSALHPSMQPRSGRLSAQCGRRVRARSAPCLQRTRGTANITSSPYDRKVSTRRVAVAFHRWGWAVGDWSTAP